MLAMQLRGDAFTPEQKLRNFDYYEALTVRDSSLSACTQAVMAAEVGHLELAYDYLAEAAFMDLQDREHNTKDGLHIASLAGPGPRWSAGSAGCAAAGRLSFARGCLRAGSLGCRSGAPGTGDRIVHVGSVLGDAPPTRCCPATPMPITHHGQQARPARTVTLDIPPIEPLPRPPSPLRGRNPAAE